MDCRLRPASICSNEDHWPITRDKRRSGERSSGGDPSSQDDKEDLSAAICGDLGSVYAGGLIRSHGS